MTPENWTPDDWTAEAGKLAVGERWRLLFDVGHHLSGGTLAYALPRVWLEIDTDRKRSDRSVEWLDLWRAAPYARSGHVGWPKPKHSVWLYRGAPRAPTEARSGLSWASHPNVAKLYARQAPVGALDIFATRHVVWRASVSPERMLAEIGGSHMGVSGTEVVVDTDGLDISEWDGSYPRRKYAGIGRD